MLAALLSLPIPRFVHRPAWRLGVVGLAPGAVGYMASPVILFAAPAGWIRRNR